MATIRGRSVRSRTGKGRLQSEGDAIRLDYRKDTAENLREVLVHLARADITKEKKLSYYNAFVRLRYRFGPNLDQSLTREEVLVCLRHGLFHRSKEMRAGTLRAVRHLLSDWSSVEALLKLHIDYLVARSLDICLDNEIERINALRLIRKIISIAPAKFPSSLLNPMISIVSDGFKMRDKLLKTCLATISELALYNAKLVAGHGGIGAILQNVLECHHLPRINESLMATVLYMLNHPKTRSLVKADVDLEKILAPFTDFDYKYATETSDQSGEESEFKYDACKMALATIMKSWPGIFRLFKPDGSGLQSFIGMLYLPNMETRKEIMDVLFDVFRLSVPLWTDSFSLALVSIDPSEMNESWTLMDGFVMEEGKSLLPHLGRTRPNLVDNHMAIVLSAFISAGLLEAITEMITTGDQYVSVRATILLGELLHLSTSILPETTNYYHQCLPSLVERASNFVGTSSQQSQAAKAISCLAELDAMKRRGIRPCNLCLAHLLNCANLLGNSSHQQQALVHHLNKVYLPLERYREVVNQLIRDSQVLYTKDNRSWDWNLVATLFKWPNEMVKRLEDQQLQRFIRRLIYLFKPSTKVYSVIELTREDVRKMTKTGLILIEFLLKTDSEESQKSMNELLADIKDCLNEVVDQKNSREVLFAASSLTQTCSQYYFLFIGKISSFQLGNDLLEEMKIYQILMNLMCRTAQDIHVKLITSSLDYTRSGCQKILSRGLTSVSETSRLYLTSFMRVLLRLRLPSFSCWGINALVTQLSDQSKSVAMEALSVLSEACEDHKNLTALIKKELSIVHLGHKGDLLFARLLSVEEGFQIFSKSKNPSTACLVDIELEKWHAHYNLKYVQIVEGRLNEALTTYEKTYDGSYVRRSHRRIPRKDVLLPVHLYGQLVQHEKGTQLLAKQPYLSDIFDALRYMDLKNDVQVLKVKAALWAVGHMGRSVWGIGLLLQNDIVPTIIKLAEDSGVFTIRGTAIYVLGLIASTPKGADILHEFGWEAVRHPRTGTIKETGNLVEDCDQTEAEIGKLASHSWSLNALEGVPDGQSCYSGYKVSYPQTRPISASLIRHPSISNQMNIQVRPRLPSVSEGKDFDMRKSDGCEDQFSDEPVQPEALVSQSWQSTELSSKKKLKVQQSTVYLLPLEHDSNVVKANHLYSSNEKFVPLATLSSCESPPICVNAVPRMRKSFSDDVADTAGSSGVSSYESGNSNTGMTSRRNICSSSLDTAKQLILQNDSIALVVEPADSLRKAANLKPIPVSVCFSQTLPCSSSLTAERGKTGKDYIDQQLFMSLQDHMGYSVLRELKPSRTNNRELSQNNRPTSLADAYMSKTRSLDFRHKPRITLRSFVPKMKFHGKLISSCAGLGPLRSSSLEILDEFSTKTCNKVAASAEVLSCVPQDLKDRHSSLPSLNSSVFGRPEFLGLCVPVNISMIFQVMEGEDLRSQVSDSDKEIDNDIESPKSKSRASKISSRISWSPEETRLFADHDPTSCLGCYRIHQRRDSISDSQVNKGEFSNVFPSSGLDFLSTPAFKMNPSSCKCSLSETTGGGGAEGGSSATSQTSGELALAEKDLLSESNSTGKAKLIKEVLRLVINLSSSVGVKSTEQALLIMKQKYPTAFQDLCVYSEVCLLLNQYSFRLNSRRFIQELFQDLNFDECMVDPQHILNIPEDCIDKFSEQFGMEHVLHQVIEY